MLAGKGCVVANLALVALPPGLRHPKPPPSWHSTQQVDPCHSTMPYQPTSEQRSQTMRHTVSAVCTQASPATDPLWMQQLGGGVEGRHCRITGHAAKGKMQDLHRHSTHSSRAPRHLQRHINPHAAQRQRHTWPQHTPVLTIQHVSPCCLNDA
jgi:hypothetical protein